MTFEEYVQYLAYQPLGTVAILDMYVFFKTLDKSGGSRQLANADRWYCPTGRFYYDGTEMASAATMYVYSDPNPDSDRKLVVIG